MGRYTRQVISACEEEEIFAVRVKAQHVIQRLSGADGVEIRLLQLCAVYPAQQTIACAVKQQSCNAFTSEVGDAVKPVLFPDAFGRILRVKFVQRAVKLGDFQQLRICLLYTSPSPRD